MTPRCHVGLREVDCGSPKILNAVWTAVREMIYRLLRCRSWNASRSIRCGLKTFHKGHHRGLGPFGIHVWDKR